MYILVRLNVMYLIREKEKHMTTVKSTEARSNWSELLSRVKYGGERIKVCRHGKTAAVLVSEKDAELLEKLEDAIDIREARRVLESDEEPIPWDEAKEDLGL